MSDHLLEGLFIVTLTMIILLQQIITRTCIRMSRTEVIMLSISSPRDRQFKENRKQIRRFWSFSLHQRTQLTSYEEKWNLNSIFDCFKWAPWKHWIKNVILFWSKHLHIRKSTLVFQNKFYSWKQWVHGSSGVWSCSFILCRQVSSSLCKAILFN